MVRTDKRRTAKNRLEKYKIWVSGHKNVGSYSEFQILCRKYFNEYKVQGIHSLPSPIVDASNKKIKE